MLSLKSDSTERWIQQVTGNVRELLIDHAHCERKAAGTAMTLINSYVEQVELVRELSPIVTEELEHFELVLDILKRRGMKFCRIKPSGYGRLLSNLVRTQEPSRAIDRLLVAALIEARSCERFALLKDHIGDPELAEFYGGLFESEARHHMVYVRLATLWAPESTVRERLEELATEEAAIIDAGDELPRMHS